jgi:hypothetical protein
MMSLLKKLLMGLIVIVALCAVALAVLPWQKWLETELKAELAARGLGDIQFEVGHIGMEGITLNHLSLGEGTSATLESVTLGYAIADLLEGKVKELHTGALAFKQGDVTITIDGLDAQIDAGSPGTGMHGAWTLRNIAISGLPVPLPVMQGNGQFSLDEVLSLKGKIQSADAKHSAMFGLDYPVRGAGVPTLTLANAQLPWSGGVIRLGQVVAEINSREPLVIPVLVEQVSLAALLQQAVGEGASATGVVSGQIPLTIGRDGAIMLQNGSLKTSHKGLLSLPPSVIPGDHPQVDVVREILKQFHYDDISLTMRSDNPKKLSMLLSLKGSNPDVYNGRQVNLNVNLTGDLLDLIRQGMVTIVDPKQLLKWDADAKK